MINHPPTPAVPALCTPSAFPFTQPPHLLLGRVGIRGVRLAGDLHETILLGLKLRLGEDIVRPKGHLESIRRRRFRTWGREWWTALSEQEEKDFGHSSVGDRVQLYIGFQCLGLVLTAPWTRSRPLPLLSTGF